MKQYLFAEFNHEAGLGEPNIEGMELVDNGNRLNVFVKAKYILDKDELVELGCEYYQISFFNCQLATIETIDAIFRKGVSIRKNNFRSEAGYVYSYMESTHIAGLTHWFADYHFNMVNFMSVEANVRPAKELPWFVFPEPDVVMQMVPEEKARQVSDLFENQKVLAMKVVNLLDECLVILQHSETSELTLVSLGGCYHIMQHVVVHNRYVEQKTRLCAVLSANTINNRFPQTEVHFAEIHFTDENNRRWEVIFYDCEYAPLPAGVTSFEHPYFNPVADNES